MSNLLFMTTQVHASYRPAAVDILPHAALPLVLVLSLFSPPFRGRSTIFITLIVVLGYACSSSPWPPNSGDTRPVRYGMTGSWIFVLPVLEKLLLHVPERDFWRTDAASGPNGRSPRGFSWEKLRWAIALFATPRAIGWNFSSRKIEARRNAVSRQGLIKGLFLVKSVLRASLVYLALDAVILYARTAVIPECWIWDARAIGRIALLDLLMAISVYTTMSIQFEIAATISVAFSFSQPEDWPPLFGNILDCYTVANVWGKFWHDYIRQPALGFSHEIVRLLGLPRRSTSAYVVHLLTAFVISAFFHILSLSVVCPGYLSVGELVTDMSLFFTAQLAAAVVEKIVIDTYTRRCHLHVDRTGKGKGKGSPILQSKLLRRLFGYVWVVTWFSLSGWWFVRPYAAIGVLEWPLPFSFFQRII